MSENNQEMPNIDFNKLLQESKTLMEMINQDNVLGGKLNEILKMFINLSHIQNERLEQSNKTATEWKEKYENLKEEYDDLQKDFDLIYKSNERKKQLLQIMKDNEED